MSDRGEAARGKKAPHPKTPNQALSILKQGNLRYRRGQLELRDYSPVGENRANEQKPLAAIITCADSRLSPTLIFDLQRGNLFVSRVAGNSVEEGTLGSTEYAVAVLGVKLVMILGHSGCGAVEAAISVVNGTASYPADRFGAIGGVIDRVTPAIEAVPEAERSLKHCTKVNARAQAAKLASLGPIVKPAVDAGELEVVAGVYDISSGRVSIV